MSNAIDTLNRVKAVLGLEVKMEQLKLENGTIIEANKFEESESVFIVTEDEKVALPIGSYQLEDNRILTVEEEGVIAKLADHEEEEEVEKVEEEEKEEVEAQYVSKEEFSQALEEIKAMIDEVKAGYKKLAENNENLGSEKADEKAELQAELSKPAVQPFKHSPEKTAKRQVVQFAERRPKNMLDIVFEKLNN